MTKQKSAKMKTVKAWMVIDPHDRRNHLENARGTKAEAVALRKNGISTGLLCDESRIARVEIRETSR